MEPYRHLLRQGCAVLLLTLAANVHAQSDSCKNHLSMSLNFMTHGEVRGGGLPKPASNDVIVENQANFLQGRTRLIVGYERRWFEAKAVVQNSAVWGMKSNMSLNLYESWVKATAPFGLFGQVGRMALSYDDERIIGPNDWAMAALSHDILRVGYEGHGHKVHALLGYNQNAENITTGTFYENGSQSYKTMHTLWYHYDLPHFPLGASLLFMNIGMQAGTKGDDAHTEYQQVMGAYVKCSPRYLTLEGSYYRQIGRNEKTAKLDAWMASAKVTVKPSDRYGFELGFDYLSGDDYMAVVAPGSMGLPRHETFKGFSPVYGSHHKFYGIMDYFYESAYIHGFTPGLQNAFVGASFMPTQALSCRVAYHYMAMATKLRGLDMTLGHDIELEAKYRFTKDISLSAGFTYMRGTDTMDRLKQYNGSKHVRWGWFSLVVSPSLFTSHF